MSEAATEAAPRLLLVDGSGYIFRAFFGLPPMTRPDGLPVNAVYGFCSMLFKLTQDYADEDIVVVFDASSKTFRNEIYPDYKANRDAPPEELRPQFALVKDAGRAFGLPVVEVAGFEADDLIATYARQALDRGREVLVVSSDKDLMQLVQDGLSLHDPMKNRAIGADEVREKFGVGPEKVRDLLALAGDSSDNVPGAPGIGPKTAAQLLETFGDLDTLLARAEEIKQPKRRQTLIEHKEQIELSKELVSLRYDAPLPIALEDTKRPPLDARAMLAFFQENGFKALINRIDSVAEAREAEREVVETALMRMESLDQLDAVIAEAHASGVLTIDLETNSLDVTTARLVGVCLATTPGTGWYAPIHHVDDFGQPIEGQLALDAVLARLRPVLIDRAVLKIGHNIKYDMAILAGLGVEVAPIDDTMLISYSLDGALNGHSMDELAKRHLDHDAIPFSEVCGKGKAQITFDRAPLDKAVAYAAEDAEVTLRLWRKLKPRIAEERMATVYEGLERPLAPLLMAMERRGIALDADYLKRLSADFTQRMAALEAEAQEQAGRPFNVGSPKQLGEVLFDEMKLDGGKKGKAGAWATGAEILERLAGEGVAIAQTILDWRQLQKLTRTYTEALVEAISPATGRVHTSYAMASTSTGRLSSTDPNLQNIPIRTEEGRKIRDAFIAPEGSLLISADYSQIELRILAHMAEIEALKDAFADDADIHAITAGLMFDTPTNEVTSDLRRSAKMINYGIIYGIGAFGLGQRLGIPQKEAKDFIERYFERYPGVKDYMERAKAEAKEKGYVATLMGRRCFIPEINAKMPTRRNYAERQAINAPIQGTAADVMKRAMVLVERRLRREELETQILLQVHDELVLEAPEGEVERASAAVKEEMEAAAQLDPRLIADVGSGRTWGAAH